MFPGKCAAGKRPLRDWFQATGKSPRWLRRFLVDNMQNPDAYAELEGMATLAQTTVRDDGAHNATELKLNDVPAAGGGYEWTCGQFDTLPVYFRRADVRSALHLPNEKENGSKFDYDTSGPAPVTLYPKLIKQIRVLIYNGDADSCVPYLGNEEWTTSMVDQGVVTEQQPWHPWYASADAFSAVRLRDVVQQRLPISHCSPIGTPGAQKQWRRCIRDVQWISFGQDILSQLSQAMQQFSPIMQGAQLFVPGKMDCVFVRGLHEHQPSLFTSAFQHCTNRHLQHQPFCFLCSHATCKDVGCELIVHACMR